MKTIAFFIGLFILTLGTAGIVAPSVLGWIAQNAVTPGAFYVIGTVRVVFGLMLVSVAPLSRAPKVLPVVGYLVALAGLATVVTGLVAMDRARAIIEWWMQQGPAMVRLAGLGIVVLGSFVAYACAPVRQPAWARD